MSALRQRAVDPLRLVTSRTGPVVTGEAPRDRTPLAGTVPGSIRPVAPATRRLPRPAIHTHLQLVPPLTLRLQHLFSSRAEGSPAPRGATEASTEPRRARRLAFIEDSVEDYKMLSRVFRDCGTLHHWTSAEDALSSFERGEVDLAEIDALIVDLHLPGVDGVELVRAARSLPGGAVPVICMLTSSSSQQDIDRARRAGADGYLVKPQGVAGLRALPAQVAEIAASR